MISVKCLRTEAKDGNSQTHIQEPHSFQTFLVGRAITTDKYLDLTSNQLIFMLLERADDAFEGSSNVEVDPGKSRNRVEGVVDGDVPPTRLSKARRVSNICSFSSRL